jgi:hypothetical protein
LCRVVERSGEMCAWAGDELEEENEEREREREREMA